MKYLIAFIIPAFIFSYSVPQKVRCRVTYKNKGKIVHTYVFDKETFSVNYGQTVLEQPPNSKNELQVDRLEVDLIKE